MNRGHKIISPIIQEYCEENSSNEPLIAKTIFNSSRNLSNSHMLIGKIIGNLLRILISMSNGKNVLEIGTFTGYSAAMIASVLPVDGKLITIEECIDTYKLATKNLSKLINCGKISVINSEGLEWLSNYKGIPFDIIFLDARKETYIGKIELIYKSLSLNGLLIIDNSLARCAVLKPEKKWQVITNTINNQLSRDKRFISALLPIRDGIFLAKRIK